MYPETEQLVEEGTVVPNEVEETKLSDESRDTLAKKIGPMLDEVRGDEPDPDDTEELDEGTTATEGDADTEQEATEDESTEGDESKEAAETGDEPVESTLPVAYRRSMKAHGWTDEEIANFCALDNDKAMQVAERIHTDRNAVTAEFARIGRTLQGMDQAAWRKSSDLTPSPSVRGGILLPGSCFADGLG